MNLQIGLQRVSAVWWGFWGLLAGAGGLVGIISEGGNKSMALWWLVALVPIYLLHRVTCWVVAGFFGPTK